MKYLKSLGYLIAADILSLFIGITLASSSTGLIRFISAVCTVGILVCMLANFAMNTAREDMRGENKSSPAAAVAMGAVTSLPSAVSWILLYISHSTGAFDFYKWHKIINGFFLQIYNFINYDASTSALSTTQVMAMLPLVFVPFLIFTVTYFVVRRAGK